MMTIVKTAEKLIAVQKVNENSAEGYNLKTGDYEKFSVEDIQKDIKPAELALFVSEQLTPWWKKTLKQIKSIFIGTRNELLNKQVSLYEERMYICKRCPLFKETKTGPICNNGLILNPITNDHRPAMEKIPGYIKGCGCRLEAKTRDPKASCPAKKW